jgi:hypothetical protein
MFQQALWYADADAQIAWLLLVGAVEAAAETWTPPSVTALERLRLAWPELEAVLERGDPVVAEQSAKMLAGQVRVTRRFLAFLGTFLPPPPDERPTEAWRLDWGDMEDKLRTIYRHRSKALHAGVPFPLPMCQAPREEPDGGWEELPSGLATHVGDAVWPVASTPMLLHVFAHIVAGALCGWWRTL